MKKLILILFLFTGVSHGQSIINSYAHAVVGGGGGAVPVLESQAQSSFTSVATIAATAPSGIVDDNVLYACLTIDSGSDHTIVAPTGWTRETGLDNQANGNETAWFSKTAASESGTYTFSWTGSESGQITIFRVSGSDTSDHFGTIGTKVNGTSTSGADDDMAGVTSVEDNTLVISYLTTDRGYTFSGNETINGGTGWTMVNQIEGWGGSGGVSFALLEKDMASSGSSGVATIGDFDSAKDFNTQAFTIKSN